MTQSIKFLSRLLAIWAIMHSNAGWSMDLNDLISSGIINKTDSLGRNIGINLDIDSTSRAYYTILCNYIEPGKLEGIFSFMRKIDDGTFKVSSLFNGDLTCIDSDSDYLDIYFNDNGTISFTVDSVRPIDEEMFPAVYEAAEKCKATEVGKYGIVQFYIRCYNEDDGSLKEEGWHCNFLGKNNGFDSVLDPEPIGIQKFYIDGKVIEKDETDDVIERLLYYAEHYDEQRDFDCDHAK